MLATAMPTGILRTPPTFTTPAEAAAMERLYFDDGKRRTRKASTKAGALQAKADLVAELTGTKPRARSSGFTLEQARRLSIKTRWAGKSWEKTAAIYSGQAVEFFGKETPVGAITAAKAQAWIDQLLKGGNAAATVNRKLSCLRAMLGDAALHGHLAAMPVLPKQLRANNGRERILEDWEMARIQAALVGLGRQQTAELLTFLLETGCRVGEALKLKGQDVDLGARRVTFWDTKNSRPRTVPLTGRAVDALASNLPAVRGHRVFPLTYDELRRHWDRAKVDAGIEDDSLVMHSLRHSCATRLARAGISQHQLMAWGGWRSSAVMRYLHHNVDSLSVCVEALEAGVQSDASTGFDQSLVLGRLFTDQVKRMG
jgi:integrase